VDGDVSRGAATPAGSFGLDIEVLAADLAAAGLRELVALELTMIGSSEIVAPGVADCARQPWLAVDISSASVRLGAMPARMCDACEQLVRTFVERMEFNLIYSPSHQDPASCETWPTFRCLLKHTF
jgi:hypothetical protein